MNIIDRNLLNEKYEIFYSKAVSMHKSKNYAFAREYYLKAAEVLFNIAKLSTDQLKLSQIENAKHLIKIADNIELIINKDKVLLNNNHLDSQDTINDSLDKKKFWVPTETPEVHFDDIAGLDDVKEAIKIRMINPIKYPDIYKVYNKKSGGGVLLYGPSGTGKTTIARAIACEVGATFYAIKGSDIISKWVGESEKNISSLFETARNQNYSIVFIDEIDGLFSHRGVDSNNDKRVNEFLQQMDGITGVASNILLLGATNRPWDIDAAAVRSGRFSEKIYVPLPDYDSRMFLFKKFIKDVPKEDDVNFDELVKKSDGYSGADIEELCDRATIEPLKKATESGIIVKIAMSDFDRAFLEVNSTVSHEEIIQYEKYAGINIKKDEKTTYKKQDENVVITLMTNDIHVTLDEDAVVEFCINKTFSDIFVGIEGVYYTCQKVDNHYITEPLDIKCSGEYVMTIYSEQEIGKVKVNFIKGIEDYDMGI